VPLPYFEVSRHVIVAEIRRGPGKPAAAEAWERRAGAPRVWISPRWSRVLVYAPSGEGLAKIALARNIGVS
jgi:hypothetical protein